MNDLIRKKNLIKKIKRDEWVYRGERLKDFEEEGYKIKLILEFFKLILVFQW